MKLRLFNEYPIQRYFIFSFIVLLNLMSNVDAQDFKRADRPREFNFPQDDGNHPEYKTEWWYLTGNLKDSKGNLYGIQATWFRSLLSKLKSPRQSPLAVQDVFFFHGALTDVSQKEFSFDQRSSRKAKGWAHSDSENLNVKIWGDTLKQIENTSQETKWEIKFRVKQKLIQLTLTATTEPLLHGEIPGLSQKGSAEGQASYYYSRPRLQARGTIKDRVSGKEVVVDGSLWFDHEFGSNQLSKDQVGWDWFSVPLDDGTDLMLYLIRKKDGTLEAKSSGTIRLPDGKRHHLVKDDFKVEVLQTWTSPESGGIYPSKWKLRVPKHNIELEVEPVISGQELLTQGTTGVNYFEGLCRFTGKRNTKAITGYGYVELVGYAGEFVYGL